MMNHTSFFIISSLTFAVQAMMVSSFQFGRPNNLKFMLTKRQNSDCSSKLTTTKAGGDLLDTLSESHGLTPLERVALTCNGNLQMVFSSYHLQPVEVSVDEFALSASDEDIDTARPRPLAVYDRIVSMSIAGDTFCKATSKVRVYDEDIFELLTTQDVGIGQLLRLKKLHPKYTLHDAGRSDDGGLWRFYSMDVDDVIEFDILEEFASDAWDAK